MCEKIKRWLLKRRIAKKLKGVNWEECKRWNNGWYRQSGEFQALEWLKSYSEGLASSEPSELLMAILTNGNGMDRKNQDFAATILRYMK